MNPSQLTAHDIASSEACSTSIATIGVMLKNLLGLTYFRSGIRVGARGFVRAPVTTGANQRATTTATVMAED
jgi:hypothetical protein